MKSGIPQRDIEEMASDWSNDVEFLTLDPRIVEIEAANLAKQYERSHAPEYGSLAPECPDGVIRTMVVQLNSASTEEVRTRKVYELEHLLEEYQVQGVGFTEVGVNWSMYPPSQNLASWF